MLPTIPMFFFPKKKEPAPAYIPREVLSFHLPKDELGRMGIALGTRGLSNLDIINIETTSEGYTVWCRTGSHKR